MTEALSKRKMFGDQTWSNMLLGGSTCWCVLLSANVFEHCSNEQLVLQCVIHCLLIFGFYQMRLTTIRRSVQTGKCLGSFFIAIHFPIGQGFLNVAYTMGMFLTQQYFNIPWVVRVVFYSLILIIDALFEWRKWLYGRKIMILYRNIWTVPLFIYLKCTA